MTTEPERQTKKRGKLAFAAGLVGLIVLASVSLGVFALHNYNQTDAYLKRVLREMRETGAETTAEGCIDRIMRWRASCRLSNVLCDNFSPRAMQACLAAKDRTGYCRSLPQDRGTTRFGYRDCKRRKMTRKTRKACASAYRMLDQYCRGLLQPRGADARIQK